MRHKELPFNLKIKANDIILKNNVPLLETRDEEYAWAIKSTSGTHSYAYSLGNGISHTSSSKTDLVTDLLSLDDDPESLADFFRDNGFFLNCNTFGYEIYDIPHVINTKNIIKNLVFVLCELNSNSPNYDVLLHSFAELSTYRSINITGTSPSNLYSHSEAEPANKYLIVSPLNFSLLSCSTSEISKLLHQNKSLEDSYRYDDDTYYKADTKFDFVLNQKITFNDFPHYDPSDSPIPFSQYINLAYHYAIAADSFTIDAISLFYHISNQHKATEDSFDFDSLSSADMDDQLKELLLLLCRRICYYFINEGIRTVYPFIDENTGTKMFSIPDLITGVWYNLYSFDYSNYTYAKCAKPNCSNYFIKLKGATNSLYCCQAHARSAAQAALRQRAKAKKSAKLDR